MVQPTQGFPASGFDALPHPDAEPLGLRRGIQNKYTNKPMSCGFFYISFQRFSGRRPLKPRETWRVILPEPSEEPKAIKNQNSKQNTKNQNNQNTPNNPKQPKPITSAIVRPPSAHQAHSSTGRPRLLRPWGSAHESPPEKRTSALTTWRRRTVELRWAGSG